MGKKRMKGASFWDKQRAERGTEGSRPHHQAGVRSLMTLPGNLEFDGFLRYVDRLPNQPTKRYYNLDVRAGRHPTKKVALARVGRNRLDSADREFGPGSNGITEVERGVYGKVTVQWE